MNTQEDYWDKKIKEWTEASYEKKVKGPIEMVASLFRGGITGRMDIALKVVGPKVKGKIIMDMGCGLGDYCFKLLRCGPKKVIGIDISGVAVKEARKRAEEKGVGGEVQFIQGDLSEMKKLPEFDIAVGLGFIDYLNKDQMRQLFKLLKGRVFLFSMFERKRSFLNFLHAIYTKIQKCPGAYKYTREEMRQLIPKDSNFYFLEKDGLLFITNLPEIGDRDV